MAKVEKRIDSTVKLVQAGMKMLAKMQQETREIQKVQKEANEQIRILIDAQIRTDSQIQVMSSKIDRLVDSWGKNRGNGHRR